MINKQLNPWEKMKQGTQRRVEYETIHDYFWIVDFKRKYGFFMKLEITEEIITEISLKGIEISFKKSGDNLLEIILLLENQEDKEVFHVLCFDLMSAMDNHKSDLVKISKLLERLNKWKKMLANRYHLSLSIEQQMGIFSELYCLKNIVAEKNGYSVAINSWVGMHKDKQDFSLDSCVIEVKSHKTTKGNIAMISSVDQLYSEKDKFYLVSYGLTISENGLSIDDIFEEINNEISDIQSELLMVKIFESGWVPYNDKIKKEKFIVDSESIYEVNEKFPKIFYEAIDFRITEVKYKIDLSKCSEHLRTINEIFGGE